MKLQLTSIVYQVQIKKVSSKVYNLDLGSMAQ
jgi:hypothetical protein